MARTTIREYFQRKKAPINPCPRIDAAIANKKAQKEEQAVSTMSKNCPKTSWLSSWRITGNEMRASNRKRTSLAKCFKRSKRKRRKRLSASENSAREGSLRKMKHC